MDTNETCLNEEAVNFVQNNENSILNEEKHTCNLCLEEDILEDEIFTINSCGCQFCTECMKMYIETKLDDYLQIVHIPCPADQCNLNGSIQNYEIKSLLGKESFAKYEKLKLKQEIALDHTRTFCPSSNCENVVHIQEIDLNIVKQNDLFYINCDKNNKREGNVLKTSNMTLFANDDVTTENDVTLKTK